MAGPCETPATPATVCNGDDIGEGLQGKYGNLDASVISYGPCQTPTLTFAVQRHQVITAFQAEDFWSVRPHVSKAGQRCTLLAYTDTAASCATGIVQCHSIGHWMNLPPSIQVLAKLRPRFTFYR